MADTLREYLIALGFKVDEETWKKYTGHVGLAARETAELGGIALTTATAIEVMVARVARQYENLYYVSRRTGQPVGQILATQFGFRQIGLSAEQATSAIEGVAQAMRLNPGIAGMAQGITGKKNPTFENIADAINRLPTAQAARWAQLFNIPEDVLYQRRLFGPEEDKWKLDYIKRAKEAGIVVDDAGHLAGHSAEEFREFGQTLNVLDRDFGLLGTRMAMDWLPNVKGGVTLVDSLVEKFYKADDATGGWVGWLTSLVTTTGVASGAITVFAKVLGGVSIGTSLSFLSRVAGAFGAIGLGAYEAVQIINKMESKKQTGIPVNQSVIDKLPWYQRWSVEIQQLFGADPNTMESYSSKIRVPLNTLGRSRGDRNNNPGNIEYGKSAIAYGATGSDAGGFAIFPTWDTGATAAALLLHDKYQGLTVAQIQKKWVGNYDPAYLAGLEKSLGHPGQADYVPDLDSQTQVKDLIHGIMRGEGTHVPHVDNSRSLADQLSSTLPHGGVDNSRTVSVNHKTDIHVAAGANALETAREVVGQFSKVDQATLRAVQMTWR